MKPVIDIAPPVLKMKYYDIEEPVFFVGRFEETGEIALLVLDEGRPTRLSLTLKDYGMIAPVNHIFVKDYSEHEGLPESLEAAGVATRISPRKIGYGDGWLMHLNFDGEALLTKD